MEYVIITGNSSGTAGHSGRNIVSYTDYVIDGNLQYSYEDKPYLQYKFSRNDIIYTTY